MHEVGELLIGRVTGVKPYALFLTFEDGSQGLLHISEISDEFIRDIEKYGTFDDEIRVKILSIDKNNGFLRVSYKQVDDSEKYNTHDNNKKSTPINVSEADFSPLKEKLPEWIADTLKKAKEEK